MKEPNSIKPTVVLNRIDADDFLDLNSSYELAQVMKVLNKIVKE